LEEDQVRDLLKKLSLQKCMGADRMHPRVMRELGDGVTVLLTVIFERS